MTTNLTVLIINASNFAFIFLFTLYLQEIKGFDARIAGLVLLTPILFMALLSPLAGRLSDITAPRIVIGTGILFSSAGLFLCAFLDSRSSFLFIILALSLIGAGVALCQSPLVRTSVRLVQKEMFGLASGMIETMRLIGMTISIAISIIVFTAVMGDTHIRPPLVPLFIQSFHMSFLIFLGISFGGLFVALTLKNERPAGSYNIFSSYSGSIAGFFKRLCTVVCFSEPAYYCLPELAGPCRTTKIACPYFPLQLLLVLRFR